MCSGNNAGAEDRAGRFTLVERGLQVEQLFATKADYIRFLVTEEGHSVKEIAVMAGCSPKYVYAVRDRDSSARTVHGRLDQIARDVTMLQTAIADLKEQLREWLGVPDIIQRRLSSLHNQNS